jgi:tetratricopeptide (TPR) repeat protein
MGFMLTGKRLGIGLMTERWSDRIRERFRLKLDPDCTAWLDTGWYKIPCGGEFQHALHPDELLRPTPDSIWAGFMLPDTLPLISNRYGDWLCWRVAADDSIQEVLHWYHGGGDWLPFGRTTSEAIVLDCTRASTPSASYASGLVSSKNSSGDEHPSLWQWACERQELLGLGAMPTIQLRDPARGGGYHADLTRRLAENPAVLFDCILAAINWTLKEKADPGLARKFQVAWEPVMIQWMFDSSLIPSERRGELFQALGVADNPGDAQDWNRAAEVAKYLAACRSDLGWVFDVLGWCYERAGHFDLAIESYRQGILTSVFSDQSIAVRTHWYDERFRKFSAARLFALKEHLPGSLRADTYLNLLWNAPLKSGRIEIRRYWLEKAQQQLAEQNPQGAYDSFYRAGWDVGSHELSSYVEILEGLIRAAELAGWNARAAVAQVHLACLKNRLGI